METIVGPPTCFLYTCLRSVCFVFFSPLADDRPVGKSPVGTVQEPPSKLPGKSAHRFSSDGSLVSIQDDRMCTTTSSSSIVVNRWPTGRLLKYILPIPRMLETILHSFIQVALVGSHKLALINNIYIKQEKSVESEHLTKWFNVAFHCLNCVIDFL